MRKTCICVDSNLVSLATKASKQTAKCKTENEGDQQEAQQRQRFIENTRECNNRERVVNKNKRDHQQKHEGGRDTLPFPSPSVTFPNQVLHFVQD